MTITQVLLLIGIFNIIGIIFVLAQIHVLIKDKEYKEYTEFLEQEASIDTDYICYLQKQLDLNSIDYNIREHFVRKSTW